MRPILDCTLRDGGYYNNWKFKRDLVSKYLSSINHTNISHIEIGFRFKDLDRNSFGKHAFCGESYLSELSLPRGKKIGVMINGSDFLKNSKGYLSIDSMFVDAKHSQLQFVRIAIDSKKAIQCKRIAKKLEKKGYQVMINLMQANILSKNKLERVISNINSWNTVSTIYFADSLGAMNPEEVRIIFRTIRKHWKGDIGFHAHDSKSLALINTLTAYKIGCKICDSTFLGMGRGAGNAKTESLLAEVDNNFKLKDVLSCLNSFKNLQKIYKWGPNIFYHLAAEYKIHPTYIQNLLEVKRYSEEHVMRTIDQLRKIKSTRFNENQMLSFTYFSESKHQGKWSASDFLKKKKVLVIGSGSSVAKNIGKINDFISKNKPHVITTNINNSLKNDYVDTIISSNVERVLLEVDSYKELNKQIIMPKSCFSKLLGKKLDKLNILDYGLAIKKGAFLSRKRGCFSNSSIVTAYMLLFLCQANPKEIYFAGFDGYSKRHPKFIELESFFRNFMEITKRKNFLSLTPSYHTMFLDFYDSQK